MKKLKSIISASVFSAAIITAVPFSTNAADEDIVYGTMDIPYADFYRAELENSNNAYDVDAVSSATASKWAGNNLGSFDADGNWQSGGLVAGTFNEPNTDGQGGTILGVTYPVAITEGELVALGENNYNFQQSDIAPAAYKNVTVSDGNVSFSKIVDTNGEESVEGSVAVATASNYGDYQFTVTGFPVNCDYYGVIFNTEEGSSYAMRHLENIWRNGSFSWSVGFKTTESHGNTLSYENFTDSMGKHINSITYITADGYVTVNVPTAYIPVKFDSELTIENASAGTGITTFTENAPDDFQKVYSVGDGFEVTDGEISYTDVKPGSYTLTISDGNGKYADVSALFELTSEKVPVKYDGEKLSAADESTDDDVANFIKNISSVEINGKTYSASGKNAVKIINDDGTINFDATSGRGDAAAPVFAEDGEYEINIISTGYINPYTFNASKNTQPIVTTEVTTTTDSSTTTTTTTTTTSSNNNSNSSNNNSSSKNSSGSSSSNSSNNSSNSSSSNTSTGNAPQTGVAGAGIPVALLSAATATAFILRKKNN